MTLWARIGNRHNQRYGTGMDIPRIFVFDAVEQWSAIWSSGWRRTFMHTGRCHWGWPTVWHGWRILPGNTLAEDGAHGWQRLDLGLVRLLSSKSVGGEREHRSDRQHADNSLHLECPSVCTADGCIGRDRTTFVRSTTLDRAAKLLSSPSHLFHFLATFPVCRNIHAGRDRAGVRSRNFVFAPRRRSAISGFGFLRIVRGCAAIATVVGANNNDR